MAYHFECRVTRWQGPDQNGTYVDDHPYPEVVGNLPAWTGETVRLAGRVIEICSRKL